jgi:hypothetical protein
VLFAQVCQCTADLSDAEAKAICDEHGLTIISAHMVMDAFDADFEGTVNRLKTWGADLVAMPVPPAWVRETGDYLKFARLSDALGARLAVNGFTLSYHNHSFEFQKYDGYRSADRFPCLLSEEQLVVG